MNSPRSIYRNTMLDIKKFFTEGAEPLKDGEFREFWATLSDREKNEYREMDLGGN